MKIIVIAGILACSILLDACTKDNEIKNDILYECKNLYFSGDSARSTAKTLKGHMLFSWKNNEDSWNYSIVPNLNITPAHENVCVGNSITGEECLKMNLSHFAEEENFLWEGNHVIETIEGKTIHLTQPPDYIINEIQAFCDSIHIHLILGN